MDNQVAQENLVREALKEKLEHLGILVLMDSQELLDSRDLLVRLVHLVHKALEDPQDRLEHLGVLV